METPSQFGFYHVIRAGRRVLNTPNRKVNSGQTVDGLLNELVRRPGFCPHVIDPQSPLHLYGMAAPELSALINGWYDETKVEKRLASGEVAMVRVRETKQQLIAPIVSFPTPIAEMVPADFELSEIYFDLARQFNQRLYGECYRSEYEHRDEEHLHRHGYAFSIDPNAELHPLYKAQRESIKRGEGGKAGNDAYRAAGRALQLKFWLEVSHPCGFAHKDMANPSRRLPQRVFAEINRLRKMTHDAGEMIRPVVLENAELRERVSALQAYGEEQAQARRIAEERVQVQVRAVEIGTDRLVDAEGAVTEAHSMWLREKTARETAEAARLADKQRLEQAEGIAETQSRRVAEVLHTVRRLQDETDRTKAELRASRRLIGELSESVREKDERLARQAELLRRYVGTDEANGFAPVPSAGSRPAPVPTRQEPKRERTRGARGGFSRER